MSDTANTLILNLIFDLTDFHPTSASQGKSEQKTLPKLLWQYGRFQPYPTTPTPPWLCSKAWVKIPIGHNAPTEAVPDRPDQIQKLQVTSNPPTIVQIGINGNLPQGWKFWDNPSIISPPSGAFALRITSVFGRNEHKTTSHGHDNPDQTYASPFASFPKAGSIDNVCTIFDQLYTTKDIATFADQGTPMLMTLGPPVYCTNEKDTDRYLFNVGITVCFQDLNTPPNTYTATFGHDPTMDVGM